LNYDKGNVLGYFYITKNVRNIEVLAIYYFFEMGRRRAVLGAKPHSKVFPQRNHK